MTPLYSSPSCFQAIDLVTPDKMSVVIISLFIAVFSLILIKKEKFSTKSKVGLIYLHLTTLFFPMVFLSTQTACGVFCMSCSNSLPVLVMYALPTTLLVSTIGGFVFIPAYFTLTNRKSRIKDRNINSFVKKYSRILNIKKPVVYAVDKAKPLAFSFRSIKSAIFMSTGMLEIMNRKEIEAVLLHEMAHLKKRSSALKFSIHQLKFFSPLSMLTRFHHDSNKEEMDADEYVVQMQKTKRHLNSAKRKMVEYKSFTRRLK